MSVWVPLPGILVSPQPDRAPGERPELLPQPSDATKHWYYYGCLACDEICVNKPVVTSLCTPEEHSKNSRVWGAIKRYHHNCFGRCTIVNVKKDIEKNFRDIGTSVALNLIIH
jgi:hypothetical protein